MLLTRAQLTSDTLRLEAEDAIVGMPETGPLELAGDIRYRGDLTRLQQWLSDPTKPMKCRVGGTISGEGRIKQTGGMAVGQLDNTIEHLVVQGSSGRQYYEPRVHLVARGSYEQQKQLLNLEQLQLEADPLNGAARGKLSSQDERTDVQLTGQLNYDLDKLSALLYPYFGAGVRVVGRGTAPVSYRGPLSLAEAQAGASMKWLGANLY